MALYQALKDKSKGTAWEKWDPAVVSLHSGATSARKTLSQQAADIKRHFKDVVLVLDQDLPGKKSVEAAMQAIPYAMVATLPAKDANACLIEGFEKALVDAVLFKKAKPKNTSLVSGTDLIGRAREETKMGYSWPWDGLTRLTRGIPS